MRPSAQQTEHAKSTFYLHSEHFGPNFLIFGHPKILYCIVLWAFEVHFDCIFTLISENRCKIRLRKRCCIAKPRRRAKKSTKMPEISDWYPGPRQQVSGPRAWRRDSGGGSSPEIGVTVKKFSFTGYYSGNLPPNF